VGVQPAASDAMISTAAIVLVPAIARLLRLRAYISPREP